MEAGVLCHIYARGGGDCGMALNSSKGAGTGLVWEVAEDPGQKGLFASETELAAASARRALCSALRYVLLHHVMGSLEGTQGAWSYVQGGMGALSDAIASSAATRGASIFTEKV